jgi:hypothetical protein
MIVLGCIAATVVLCIFNQRGVAGFALVGAFYIITGWDWE